MGNHQRLVPELNDPSDEVQMQAEWPVARLVTDWQA
jgi:hypothetical protein